MVVIEIKQLKKLFGERELFKINNLKINENEKVGIVGKNGCGKTTLLDIIAGKLEPDEGKVEVKQDFIYLKQFNEVEEESKFLSGGEKTKQLYKRKLNLHTNLVLMDEPTNHLDMESILKLEERLKKYQGTLLMISHDRTLLDHICNFIIEIEDGEVTKYKGNYTSYQIQKEIIKKTKELEYFKYIEEKNKLEKAICISKNNSKEVKKAPSRMGNSEARLHKRDAEEIREKIDGHTKALERRLEKLEEKEKPKQEQRIYMRVEENRKLKGRNVLTAEHLTIQFPGKILLQDINFQVPTNAKIALIGKNGAGKTTLIKEILKGNEKIKIREAVKIGYFSQEFEGLEEEKTILENVMQDTVQGEVVCRNILGRLLFRNQEVYKKVKVLSGGEKVKVAIAKILVSDANFLILDEPTNFLDLPSLEELEKLIIEYQGTILFVTHDRTWMNHVANYLFIIEDKKLIQYKGNYEQYEKEKIRKKETKAKQEDDLVIEMKLIALDSKIALTKDPMEKEKLEEEYINLKKIQMQNKQKC